MDTIIKIIFYTSKDILKNITYRRSIHTRDRGTNITMSWTTMSKEQVLCWLIQCVNSFVLYSKKLAPLSPLPLTSYLPLTNYLPLTSRRIAWRYKIYVFASFM